MAQKEYHNYPIGTIIYPRSNSFQELLEMTPDWDKVDHSQELYLQPCVVCSEEYKFQPEVWYFDDKKYDAVNVLYNGGIYRVGISEFWDMTTEPDWCDLLDDCF